MMLNSVVLLAALLSTSLAQCGTPSRSWGVADSTGPTTIAPTALPSLNCAAASALIEECHSHFSVDPPAAIPTICNDIAWQGFFYTHTCTGSTKLAVHLDRITKSMLENDATTQGLPSPLRTIHPRPPRPNCQFNCCCPSNWEPVNQTKIDDGCRCQRITSTTTTSSSAGPPKIDRKGFESVTVHISSPTRPSATFHLSSRPGQSTPSAAKRSSTTSTSSTTLDLLNKCSDVCTTTLVVVTTVTLPRHSVTNTVSTTAQTSPLVTSPAAQEPEANETCKGSHCNISTTWTDLDVGKGYPVKWQIQGGLCTLCSKAAKQNWSPSGLALPYGLDADYLENKVCMKYKGMREIDCEDDEE